MQQLPLAEDLITEQELVADLGGVLHRQSESGRPVVVTHQGKAAAVLLSPQMFDDLTEQRHIVGLVLQGLHDVANGNLVDDDEVWADIDELLRSAGA
jgi:prevent-host-death family protein